MSGTTRCEVGWASHIDLLNSAPTFRNGCRPWVAAGYSGSGGHDHAQVTNSFARAGVASIVTRGVLHPDTSRRGFASAAESEFVDDDFVPESSPTAESSQKKKKKRTRKPKSKGNNKSVFDSIDGHGRADLIAVNAMVSTRSTKASNAIQSNNESQLQRQKEKKKQDKQTAKLHRRSKETSRRLRSGKRQTATGIASWIIENEQRLDRFTIHLACRLLAQHVQKEKRKRDDIDAGVFRVGECKVKVGNPLGDNLSDCLPTEAESLPRANKVLWTVIARISNEVTNGHEWSRLLDAVARLLKAEIVQTSDGGNEGSKDLVSNAIHATTKSASDFAAECTPADVVGNLRALSWINETNYSHSADQHGKNEVASAAYANAVEMSDFELKSSVTFLDQLLRSDVGVKSGNQRSGSVTKTRQKKKNAKGTVGGDDKKEEKETSEEMSKKISKKSKKTKNEKSGKQLVDRVSFNAGFAATRALIQSVISARKDGSLLSISRKRTLRKGKEGGAVVDSGMDAKKKKK